jgi:hypothetical protein
MLIQFSDMQWLRIDFPFDLDLFHKDDLFPGAPPRFLMLRSLTRGVAMIDTHVGRSRALGACIAQPSLSPLRERRCGQLSEATERRTPADCKCSRRSSLRFAQHGKEISWPASGGKRKGEGSGASPLPEIAPDFPATLCLSDDSFGKRWTCQRSTARIT